MIVTVAPEQMVLLLTLVIEAVGDVVTVITVVIVAVQALAATPRMV